MALGLLAGIVLGSGAALVVDRRSGLVFSKEELESTLPCPLLEQLDAHNTSSWNDAIDLLARGPLAVAELGNIALIPVGNLDNHQLEKFASALQQALVGHQLIVSRDLVATQTCATQLIITTPGAVTREELAQLRQKLVLQGTPLAGWVMFNPTLEA
jgi:polysaccharide biosynthesis transport protein